MRQFLQVINLLDLSLFIHLSSWVR